VAGPVARLVEELEVGAVPAPGGGWVVHVPTAKRGDLAAHISATERTVTIRAFVIRAPDRGHLEIFQRLLRKNLMTREWRFAIDGAGDIYAVADAAVEGVDADALDGLLGGLSALVDEVYEGVLRTGFAVPDTVVVGAPPPAPSNEV
jgi:hypothetical protein